MRNLVRKRGIEDTYRLTDSEAAVFRPAFGFDFNWNPYQWWKGAAGQYYHQAGKATVRQRVARSEKQQVSLVRV